MDWAAIGRLLLVSLWLAPQVGQGAQAPPPVAWLTGSALQRQFGLVVPSASWTETPLRDALEELSRHHRVAVLRDRRVDPDRKLDLTLREQTLLAIFQRIAEEEGQSLSLFGPVIYLGPAEAASRLRTLAYLRREELRTLPPAAARRWMASERLHWEDLASPRQLLSELAAGGGVELRGLELIPHDLWARCDLPPLTLVDRVSLIAIQFDLTLAFDDGGGAALVPIDAETAIEREYSGGRDPQQRARELKALAPQSRIRRAGDRIVVRGSIEDHERIANGQEGGPREPAARPGPKSQETRFSGEVQGMLGQLLRQLAGQLNLELQIDEEAMRRAGVVLTQPVSIRVQNASIDELLEKILAPAGCDFRRTGSRVEVFPRG